MMVLHILTNSLTLARKNVLLGENTLLMITSPGPTATVFFRLFFKGMIAVVNSSYL